MNLSALCTREVVTISAQATLHEAAALMCEEHVGSLVVLTEDEPPQVAGLLTDRDLALDVIGRNEKWQDLRVAHVAKAPALAVSGNAGLQEAVAAMEKRGVRRLLVVDENGGVIGLVAAEDLMAAISEELAGLVRALRGGIAREQRERKVFRGPATPRPVFPVFGTATQ